MSTSHLPQMSTPTLNTRTRSFRLPVVPMQRRCLGVSCQTSCGRPNPANRARCVSHCLAFSAPRKAASNASACRSHANLRTSLQASTLSELELQPIVNVEGLINPEVPQDIEASVFAVYDSKQKLQYVGFSKDMRNSLRTLFSRRPDKAYYFKAEYLPSVDQKAMIQIRDAWFVECGGPPSGNKLPVEKSLWQQPVDAGAISQRGKQGAAEDMAIQLQRLIKDRGCKEEFIANPALLPEGQVDFLPADALSLDDLEVMKQARLELAKKQRTCKTVVDGQEKPFSLLYQAKYPTNGGFMMDIMVNFDHQDTEHRIIVGKEYYEPNGVDAESVIESAMSLILNKKVPRKTEGVLLSSQFPVNYFSVSQLEQWYEAEFAETYERVIGEPWTTPGDYWRFNKINDYGPVRNESVESLNIAIGGRSD